MVKHTFYLKKTVFSSFICFCIVFFLTTSGNADNNIQSPPHTVTVQGIHLSDITEKFYEHSLLNKIQEGAKRGPRTIQKMICQDQELLAKLLQSYGYYDATIHSDQESDNVKFNVDKGIRYRFRQIIIHNMNGNVLDVPDCNLTKLFTPLKRTYVNAERLETFLNKLVESLSHCGYPFAKVVRYRGSITEDKKLDVILTVDTGPQLVFGLIHVGGSTVISKQYIKNRAPFQKGELFDQRKIDRYIETLQKKNIFQKVLVSYTKENIDGNALNIQTDVSDRPFKTIEGSLKYSLTGGIGAKAAWNHRNITGQADTLGTSLTISERLSAIDLNYELPDFWEINQFLIASIEGSSENTRAYKSNSIGGSITLRQLFNLDNHYFWGLSTEYSQVREGRKKVKSETVGVPVGIHFQDIDNLLDPTRGYKLTTIFTPDFGKIGSENFMAKVILQGSAYHSLKQNTIVALWARLGSILGISRDNTPANKRFYAGGGGSIRGYGYQLAGPVDAYGTPTGGKSLLEGGVELRQKFTENWGGVLFFDGGYVDNNTIPTFNENFFAGTGVGIRYYTDFGPIRFDVAIPVTGRRKSLSGRVDSPFQIYVSIGQSF
jgi:translocation and assembly module TamA